MRLPQWIPTRPDLAGVGLSAALGLCAMGIGKLIPPSPYVSDILIALALGGLVVGTPLGHLVGVAPPSAEREPDRWAAGLRYTGKWVLRGGIILMGLKVQTSFFGASELALILGVVVVSVPSAFFAAHALSALLGIRRPMADLLAGGTMICGASAVNAIAPIAGARREEQGLAIGTIFLFSVVALLAFRPIAALVGLDASFAGIWSGLSVNDFSSAVAVGKQMGGTGDAMAAASKSARVVMLAPTLVVLALLRRGGPRDVKKSALDQLPAFVLGYLVLAVARAAGDRLFGASPAWKTFLDADKLLVDVAMLTVAASIGLHLSARSLIAAGGRAVAVGGGASVWMATVTLAMVTLSSRGAHAAAALAGAGALLASFISYRATSTKTSALARLERRFESGAPLSLAEATDLLGLADAETRIDDAFLRRLLAQLHPAIGELIPVRESPLPHGEGCRWVTYWQGAQTGWALVAMCREPGSATPIHAHPHRLLGKAIEGVLEEIRFEERAAGKFEVVAREVLGHNELVETDGLATVHLVRVAGDRPAIDLQLRGPEVGKPGRRMRPRGKLDVDGLAVGVIVEAEEEVDDRPGHGGEGAGVGVAPAPV